VEVIDIEAGIEIVGPGQQCAERFDDSCLAHVVRADKEIQLWYEFQHNTLQPPEISDRQRA
jgi:hypothetical protein